MTLTLLKLIYKFAKLIADQFTAFIHAYAFIACPAGGVQFRSGTESHQPIFCLLVEQSICTGLDCMKGVK